MASRKKVHSPTTAKPFDHRSVNAPTVLIGANDTAPTPTAALSPTFGEKGKPLSGATPTMSSREIADLCEARHNDVVATIERLFAKGVLRESRKNKRPLKIEGRGRPTEVYDLTKRDTFVVVSGYNDELRARIIDRWEALEAERALPVVSLPPEVQDLIRRTDGISRMLAHKVTEMEKVIPMLRAEFMTALVEADPRITAVTFKPSLEVLKDHDVPSKGRRGFSQKVSNRLRRYSLAHKHPMRESHETGRWLFHVDAIAGWIEGEGKALIRNHKAKLAGDGELFRLVKS